MLFDLPHTLFMLISLTLIVGLLIIFGLYIKDNKKKDLILKISAILTLIFHFSSLWVDFFTTGSAEVEETMLLPIYPCHIAMWLLVIVAFKKNKNDKLFRFLAEFTFYLGLFGGVIGIMFNEIYANNPNMLDYDVIKGLLSHDTLLFGCLFLLVGKYIKIRVFNIVTCLAGLTGLLIDGGIVIGLYKLANLTPPNCMYLLKSPFPSIPWFNTWIIGIIAIVVLFSFTTLYEFFALKKEDRWYSLIKNELNKRKKIKENKK